MLSWCPRQESNPRPSRCERAAPPAELLGHGAEGPNRTAAAQGFNLPLYCLSYLGMRWSWRRDSHPRCRGLQPRAFAARPRQPSTSMCVHRDQASNLESSRSERDVLPIPPSLCTHAASGSGGPAPPLPPRAHVEARADPPRARARTRASSFQLGYSGCERSGATPARPVTGGDSRYDAKKKGLASCQAL